MTSEPTPAPDQSADPTLAVAERQLAMLSRLASIGMAVCEAQGLAAVAASNAAVAAVSDTAWQCERDRALALVGSKDAAEAFRKGSRTLRLTLMLEKTTAEWVRDLRLGIVRPAKIGRMSADHGAGRTSAGSEIAEAERPDTETRESECLVEFERPESLSSFRGVARPVRRDPVAGSPASATCDQAAMFEVLNAKDAKARQGAAPICEPPRFDVDCLDGDAVESNAPDSARVKLFAAPA